MQNFAVGNTTYIMGKVNVLSKAVSMVLVLHKGLEYKVEKLKYKMFRSHAAN